MLGPKVVRQQLQCGGGMQVGWHAGRSSCLKAPLYTLPRCTAKPLVPVRNTLATALVWMLGHNTGTLGAREVPWSACPTFSAEGGQGVLVCHSAFTCSSRNFQTLMLDLGIPLNNIVWDGGQQVKD